MSVFRNAVFLAVLAGLVSGLALAALQTFSTVPLIHKAEVFENAAEPAAEPAQHHHDSTTAVAPHDHGEEGWAPQDGAERTLFTVAANLVTGIGFALVLVAASEMAGGILGWRQGILWGFAGFAVFTLAPGLGLPPELPAMPSADLLGRQVWWIGTVAATAAGLALIVFRREAWAALLGALLLVAPHLIGAPQPVDYASPIPEGLHHDFVVASVTTTLLFWLVLGAATGALRSRFVVQGSGTAQPRLA